MKPTIDKTGDSLRSGRRRRWISCRRSVAIPVALLVATVWSQEYKVEDATIDSGGGTSEGGRFKVEGSIGQPETGTSVGGHYTFLGGFWHGGVQVVQVAGLPQLKITKEGKNTVVLTWEDGDDRFALQESDTLKSSEWAGTEHTIQTEGTTRRVVLTDVSGRLFFRLSK